jgi:hypothetical protein
MSWSHYRAWPYMRPWRLRLSAVVESDVCAVIVGVVIGLCAAALFIWLLA